MRLEGSEGPGGCAEPGFHYQWNEKTPENSEQRRSECFLFLKVGVGIDCQEAGWKSGGPAVGQEQDSCTLYVWLAMEGGRNGCPHDKC